MSAEGREPQELAQGPGGHPGASRSGRRPPRPPSAPWRLPPWRARAAAAVLCYINLLNYMNWFIVAGMLLDLQNFFQISDGCAGLLQTVFVGCLLLSAPVFGYLGDRHSRKATLSIGILLWSGAGLSSSFLSPQYSWLFFLSRGVVGTGSASYSTIAPTVLGDLFVREQRTRVLAIFYIFIPVGSGLGYVLGSAVLQLTGNWRWAFRVMPCLEAVALILLILLVPDPPRGAAEKQEDVAVGGARSGWCEDVRYLGGNWSFVWSTLGVTAIAFVTGALGFWAPKFLFEARVVHGLQPPCSQEPCGSQDRCSWPSGSCFCPATGRWLPTSCWDHPDIGEETPGLSQLSENEPVGGGAQVPWDSRGPADHSGPHPGRRRQPLPHWTGEQQPLGGVGWGGAARACSLPLSPQISSSLRAGRPDSYLQAFLSLQQSFLCCAFIIALGGGCFLLTALRLESDQARAQVPGTGTPDSKDMESQALLSGAGTATEDP
uniref:Sphingolipid transporter 3 (putative) n=1 Tax=Suricata suricatta TaxID=37032 RepID=A0A673V3U7_SURSU